MICKYACTAFAAAALVSVGFAFRGAASTEGGAKIGAKIPQFTAAAVTTIDSHAQSRPTMYMLMGTTCPATNGYTERVLDLEKSYRAKGVDFIYVYPNKNDSNEAKLAYHKKMGFKAALVDDQGGAIAKLLGAQKTSEVFLTDKEGKVVYHGGIDDNAAKAKEVKTRFVAQALDEVLAGKAVSVTTSPVQA